MKKRVLSLLHMCTFYIPRWMGLLAVLIQQWHLRKALLCLRFLTRQLTMTANICRYLCGAFAFMNGAAVAQNFAASSVCPACR